jgi:hypothetical protein
MYQAPWTQWLTTSFLSKRDKINSPASHSDPGGKHAQVPQCRVFLRAERKGAAAMRVREVRRASSGDAGR